MAIFARVHLTFAHSYSICSHFLVLTRVRISRVFSESLADAFHLLLQGINSHRYRKVRIYLLI